MELPYLTAALPGIGGALRTRPEDFHVEEIPAYPPSGTGEHVFVRVKKRGVTTRHAAQAIARFLRIQERDIGIAGMKDRHAVTTQWLSLPPPVTPEAALALAVPDVTILEAVRHNHKLRTGHVRGNRFVLRVRDLACPVAEAVTRAQAILARLAEPPGAPNWYGEQRFGKAGDNALKGRALLAGTTPRSRRDRKLDRLMVSALQSELFNTWLTTRLADGLYATALAGDVMHKRGGGLFDCAAPMVDTPRLQAGEIVLTGPMFGDRMRKPTDDSPAAARELAILTAAELSHDSFAGVRALAEGTRRDATIAVADVAVTAVAAVAAPGAGDGETLEVAFALPGGAYATVVMRELMKVPPAPPPPPPDAA